MLLIRDSLDVLYRLQPLPATYTPIESGKHAGYCDSQSKEAAYRTMVCRRALPDNTQYVFLHEPIRTCGLDCVRSVLLPCCQVRLVL